MTTSVKPSSIGTTSHTQTIDHPAAARLRINVPTIESNLPKNAIIRVDKGIQNTSTRSIQQLKRSQTLGLRTNNNNNANYTLTRHFSTLSSSLNSKESGIQTNENAKTHSTSSNNENKFNEKSKLRRMSLSNSKSLNGQPKPGNQKNAQNTFKSHSSNSRSGEIQDTGEISRVLTDIGNASRHSLLEIETESVAENNTLPNPSISSQTENNTELKPRKSISSESNVLRLSSKSKKRSNSSQSNQIQRQKEKITTLKNMLNDRDEHVLKAVGMGKTLIKKNKQLNQEFGAIKQKYTSAKAAIQELKQRRKTLESSITRLKERQASELAEKNRKQATIAQLTGDLQTARSQLKKVREDLSTLSRESRLEQQAIMETNSQVQIVNSKLQNQVALLSNENKQLADRVDSLQVEKTNLTNKLSKLEQNDADRLRVVLQLQDVQKELEDAGRALMVSKRAHQLIESQLRKELECAETEIKNTKNQLRSVTKNANITELKLKEQQRELESLESSLNSEILGLKSLLNSREETISAARAEISQLKGLQNQLISDKVSSEEKLGSLTKKIQELEKHIEIAKNKLYSAEEELQQEIHAHSIAMTSAGERRALTELRRLRMDFHEQNSENSENSENIDQLRQELLVSFQKQRMSITMLKKSLENAIEARDESLLERTQVLESSQIISNKLEETHTLLSAHQKDNLAMKETIKTLKTENSELIQENQTLLAAVNNKNLKNPPSIQSQNTNSGKNHLLLANNQIDSNATHSETMSINTTSSTPEYSFYSPQRESSISVPTAVGPAPSAGRLFRINAGTPIKRFHTKKAQTGQFGHILRHDASNRASSRLGPTNAMNTPQKPTENVKVKCSVSNIPSRKHIKIQKLQSENSKENESSCGRKPPGYRNIPLPTSGINNCRLETHRLLFLLNQHQTLEVDPNDSTIEDLFSEALESIRQDLHDWRLGFARERILGYFPGLDSRVHDRVYFESSYVMLYKMREYLKKVLRVAESQNGPSWWARIYSIAISTLIQLITTLLWSLKREEHIKAWEWHDECGSISSSSSGWLSKIFKIFAEVPPRG